MKQVNAEIIAVGTELLLGQIANTNAQWISEQLAMYGINVHYHTVVGDNLKRVENTFIQASDRSDVIIVTGGLGPTEDDMTREAFQQITNLEIVEHTPSMNKIKTFFRKQHTDMTPNNKRQARVFKDSVVIDNNVGMAPGMIVNHHDKTWIFLPGVPREMKAMVTKQVLPYVAKLMDEQMIIKSTMLRFIGIGESRLEHELSDIIQQQTNPTIAPLAQTEGVAIRLTAKANSTKEATKLIDQTKREILARVGTYFYGIDGKSLEASVFGMLKKQGRRLAAAESLTGGMFTERLVSQEGASEVCQGGLICYGTNVKSEVLNVSPRTISEKGTVSKECAKEMAANICNVMDADIGISFTGVAGPDEVEEKPAGTVYIGIHHLSGKQAVEKYNFHGDRQIVRHKAVLKGYEMLLKFLTETLK